MKRFLVLLPILLLAGCTDGDRAQVQKESEIAAEHAGKAATIALGSLEKQLANVDLGSSKQTILDAQAKAVKSADELKKQGGAASDQVGELEKQIERLKAAINVKDLQAKIDDLTKQAKQANETLDAARARLKEGNETFQKFQDRLAKAQEQYEALAKQTSGN